MDILNPWPIIQNHFCVINNKTNKFWMFFIFLAFPLGISFLLVHFNKTITGGAINLIVLALSIFVGFSINTTILLLKDVTEPKKELRKKLLEELYHNSIFEIFLGILVITYAITLSVLSIPYQKITSFIFYFLLANYLLTLLIMVRSLFTLLKDDVIDKGEK